MPEQKENLADSALKQWDQLASTLYKRELAPKGFSEIKRGPYRGSVQSNIPFLPKSTVTRCQNIGAQLVRSFREKVKSDLEKRLTEAEARQALAIKERDSLPFWNLIAKRKQQGTFEHYQNQIGLLHILINQLDQIGIK
jgi:hypothetical protein